MDKKELLRNIDAKLPLDGEENAIIALTKLLNGVRAGLIGNRNPRYFGFVLAGTTPSNWIFRRFVEFSMESTNRLIVGIMNRQISKTKNDIIMLFLSIVNLKL